MLDPERELARGWGAVRLSSPGDSWDLSVSVGPVMSYRITTAVVWNWQPMWRGRVVPRVTFLLAMIAACAVTVLDLRLAVVPLALLVSAAAEAWFLRRRARAAIAASKPNEITLPICETTHPKTAEPQYDLAQGEPHLARTLTTSSTT
jgi:hypothetical protein